MNVHYFQHVHFEGLGSIQNWLDIHASTVSCTRFFEWERRWPTFPGTLSDPLPDIDDVDLLIVLGGPMSVNDDIPWLAPEIGFVTAYIKRRKPILGICLGAQIIAKSLGKRIYPNPVKEIGWFPIQSVSPSNITARIEGSPRLLPDSIPVFHWHGETFDLPEEAVLLASSKGCRHQAFQIGSNIFGFQCHLEVTPESAQRIATHCRAEIVNAPPEAPYIDQPEAIYADTTRYHRQVNSLLDQILDHMTATQGTWKNR